MRFGLGAAAAAGCILRGVSAQECTASSATGYDYQVEAEDGFTIHWTVDTATEEITFQAVYEGEAWVGLGFSTTGDMVPADAVIGLPDETTGPFEYDMSTYSLSEDDVHASQEISSASVTQEAGTSTTLVFTRPLAPTDASKITLSSEEGEETIFIYAYGTSNELAYHTSSNRGSVTLTDLSCSELDEEEEEEDSTDAETAGEDCASSDPDYEFEVQLDTSLVLFWSVVDSSVSVKAVYDGEGWVGIGFSDSGSMRGSDSVVGLAEEGTVLEYDMDDYSVPEVAAEQEISLADITQIDGVTTLAFVRPLAPTGEGKQLLTVSDPTAWLYAYRAGTDFFTHTTEGSVSITLDSCGASRISADPTKTEYAHGWLMVLGWTICFPVGIMYARFSSNFASIGFPAHRILQSLGTVFVIAGFACAVAFTEDFGLDHFSSTHGKVGLILTIFVMLQVVAAIFRPSKPPAGQVVQDERGHTKPAPVSKVRQAWTILHRTLGYIAAVWAIFQCFGGLDALEADDAWQLAFFVLVIVLVVAFVVLQSIACFKAKRTDSPVDLSGPQHDQATTGTRNSY